MQDDGEAKLQPNTGDRDMEMELTFGGGLEELGQRLLSQETGARAAQQGHRLGGLRAPAQVVLLFWLWPRCCPYLHGCSYRCGRQQCGQIMPRCCLLMVVVCASTAATHCKCRALHAEAHLVSQTGRSGRQPRRRAGGTSLTARM